MESVRGYFHEGTWRKCCIPDLCQPWGLPETQTPAASWRRAGRLEEELPLETTPRSASADPPSSGRRFSHKVPEVAAISLRSRLRDCFFHGGGAAEARLGFTPGQCRVVLSGSAVLGGLPLRHCRPRKLCLVHGHLKHYFETFPSCSCGKFPTILANRVTCDF